MSVQEDPDELGYWVGQPNSPRPEGWDRIQSDPLDAIMPKAEQAELGQAAHLAFNGDPVAAESHRRWAGYDNVSIRPDADYV